MQVGPDDTRRPEGKPRVDNEERMDQFAAELLQCVERFGVLSDATDRKDNAVHLARMLMNQVGANGRPAIESPRYAVLEAPDDDHAVLGIDTGSGKSAVIVAALARLKRQIRTLEMIQHATFRVVTEPSEVAAVTVPALAEVERLLEVALDAEPAGGVVKGVHHA